MADLNYTWACRLSKDKDIIDAFTIDDHSVVTPDMPTNKKGCFSTGIGRLATTDRETVFQSSTLKKGESFIFYLVVKKDTRRTLTTKTCTAVEPPPRLALK